MILNASQRGGAAQLGVHLLKSENEHVEVHEIRGFAADDLKGAMKEAQAVARGTRCKQFLFSVSLNPPQSESVSVDVFEAAIDRIEEAHGLSGQPRMIVFHEKEGRRHAHAVWSRIDAETMTARPLPHFKLKLRDISKSLYLEHSWQMPRGLMDSRERDPTNFSLAEWQQAKRMGRDPAALKQAVQECWAVSDSGPSFARALEERGLYLARGDRRAHVVVAYEGEALSLARLAGKRSKEVAAKLGKVDDLRGVEEIRATIAERIAPRLEGLIREAKAAGLREMEPLEEKRLDMAERHSVERQRLAHGQQARFTAESQTRAERFRSGVAGLWDRLTGRHTEIAQENERDAFNAYQRDRAQRDGLVADQLGERRGLQREIVAVKHRHAARLLGLYRDLARRREGASVQHGPPRHILRGRSGRGREGPELGR